MEKEHKNYLTKSWNLVKSHNRHEAKGVSYESGISGNAILQRGLSIQGQSGNRAGKMESKS